MPDHPHASPAHKCTCDEHQPFIASFDVRPTTASCACRGGKVHAHEPTKTSETPAPAANDHVFEQLVQAITDQIMAAKGRG